MQCRKPVLGPSRETRVRVREAWLIHPGVMIISIMIIIIIIIIIVIIILILPLILKIIIIIMIIIKPG